MEIFDKIFFNHKSKNLKYKPELTVSNKISQLRFMNTMLPSSKLSVCPIFILQEKAVNLQSAKRRGKNVYN